MGESPRERRVESRKGHWRLSVSRASVDLDFAVVHEPRHPRLVMMMTWNNSRMNQVLEVTCRRNRPVHLHLHSLR